jgi:hypothetical protein
MWRRRDGGSDVGCDVRYGVEDEREYGLHRPECSTVDSGGWCGQPPSLSVMDHPEVCGYRRGREAECSLANEPNC